MADTRHILVLTCGNPMAGDDGVGPMVAHLLQRRPIPGVKVLDTQMNSGDLPDDLSGFHRLVIVDAVRDETRPVGAVIEWGWFDDDRPELMNGRIVSSHNWSLPQHLQLAGTIGMLPDEVRLIGVCIHQARLGDGLSPATAHAAWEVVKRIRESAEKRSAEEACHVDGIKSGRMGRDG